ncbi:MAG TPA: nuclear transport factor 2 family protein [Tahibacter sp.]|uniref:nuclear transport factor 2 family protein n=1 Tax=Tahibacter sp. TaxID=2056211 RepID=UPI002BC12683|nr:nuclear transport factor 2 family protein [Tahibacter sp.]HSX60996.1 nuclear transport factor 2 family protein [Tahibacter sp.]
MRPILRLLAFCAMSALAACSRTPDEQRIRDAVAAMEAAVEARNPRDFMAYVADDFVGRDGGFDRAALHNLLRGQFLRNEAIGVVVGPVEITMQPPRATARMSVTLTGGSGELLPERGAVYQVETGWKLVDGEWRCLSATWQEP